MRLTSRRFILRDFEDGDRADFLAYHADPRLQEFNGPGENTQGHAAQLFDMFKAWAAEVPRRNYQLAVVHREGQLVGCAGLRMKDMMPGTAEFGMELTPAYWGRYGYAIESMSCLMDFGFRELGLDWIVGSTVSGNSRIVRLAKAFGAVSEELPGPAWMEARGWCRVLWRISREQWLAGPGPRGHGVFR